MTSEAQPQQQPTLFQRENLEASLWQMADKLRNNMDAAEYKHIVLGLLFLKYISDAFYERRATLETLIEDASSDYYLPDTLGNREDAKTRTLEDKDEYVAARVFWVPSAARWEHIQASAKLPEIGRLLDDAMTAIEKENPSLKGVLPKEYARPALDKVILGGLIDLVSKITLGDSRSRGLDVLGKVYEYFLRRFAAAEGKHGGEFYTPPSVVGEQCERFGFVLCWLFSRMKFKTHARPWLVGL